MSLKGDIVKEYLEKWPELPSHQLARMIYNSENNHLVFTDKESVRTAIRYYRGSIGDNHRKKISSTKYFKNENRYTENISGGKK
jgi:hypothetical protein